MIHPEALSLVNPFRIIAAVPGMLRWYTMDLRLPLALMFILLGGILALYGWLAPQDVAPVDPGIRVNVVWGSLMCLFGLVLGALAMRSRRRS